MTITDEQQIMNSEDIHRTLKRMSYEILDSNRGAHDLAILGLQTRGVYIARRIADMIGKTEKTEIPVGILDVTMYRDDFRVKLKQPDVKVTSIPFEVDGTSIVMVDDVFYTGRTVRSAMDAIISYGRPGRIELAVLVDRGHRELPICADHIGKAITTQLHQEVRVRMKEIDGIDEVTLVTMIDEGGE